MESCYGGWRCGGDSSSRLRNSLLRGCVGRSVNYISPKFVYAEQVLAADFASEQLLFLVALAGAEV